LSTRLPAAEASVAEARDFTTAALRSWGVPGALSGDIVLAVSELVTNAIEHGTGVVDVEVLVDDAAAPGGAVRLRVGDRASALPVRRQPSLLSERYRGLVIVEALADEWGHDVVDEGRGPVKWVWAQFALPVLAVDPALSSPEPQR
jgi:anti-sigma regulatory factor (Ser/Thr protein kinase)